MNATIAAIVSALGLAVCVMALWRATRGPGLSPRQRRRRTEDLRRQLSRLKEDHAKGKVDDEAYRVRKNELGRQYIAVSHPEPVPARPERNRRWLALAVLGLAGTVLGVVSLTWSTPPAAPDADVAISSSPAASAAHPLRTEQVENAVAQMRDRVKNNPKDSTAWAMLAHSYDMLGRHSDAVAAYSKLIELAPNDPQVLVDAADSMALARGRRFDGEPMKLIQRALSIDPKNLKALSLAGTEAFDRRDFVQAIAYWQRARALVTEPALARELDDRIAEARALPSHAASATDASAQAAPNPSGFVAGRIELSKSLAARVAPGDVLFVFARPVDGSRMPVALMRRQASELPLEFRLDDSMAMVPQSRLSGQPRVVVGARISKQADAMPKPGDLEGYSPAVPVGARDVQVEISKVVK
jgi:cytochrome c-type biogenesis protein CcmH